jgi:hypothetical protein
MKSNKTIIIVVLVILISISCLVVWTMVKNVEHRRMIKETDLQIQKAEAQEKAQLQAQEKARLQRTQAAVQFQKEREAREKDRLQKAQDQLKARLQEAEDQQKARLQKPQEEAQAKNLADMDRVVAEMLRTGAIYSIDLENNKVRIPLSVWRMLDVKQKQGLVFYFSYYFEAKYSTRWVTIMNDRNDKKLGSYDRWYGVRIFE